ncbi:MAG: NAD(P)H-hydrate epimerase [Phycisphaerae bacterium]
MDAILTRDQIRDVDRLAIEELGIPGVVLMENAGRAAAEQIRYRVRSKQGHRAVIFCGPGNNGGDGFVIARHLTNHGIAVVVFLAGDPARLSPDCATNHGVVTKIGLEVRGITTPDAARAAAAELTQDDIVVDALMGTGFSGKVRSPMDVLIKAINKAPKSMLFAIDVPSGLDCNTGEPANAAIKADLTMTFVANKIGLVKPDAQRYVGESIVGTIGIPPSLIERVTLGKAITR